ncbi:MAG: DNA recombination protein RmuC [Candidatus Marinimicrobia bacterium]|jgi:DNA recombination protein RmuC|nr:DNA recombination protein RmuC [Candidatus Neomarinimicrobiota bacterium]
MVDIITVIISLIIGITIGWILKSFSQPKSENTNQDIITHLTEEKARAEAKLEQMEEIKDGMETVFKSLAGEITNNNTEAFLKLAGDKFNELSEKNEKTFTQKKELIDQNLGDMKKTLKSLHDQSVTLNQRLESNSQEAQKLQESTTKLREILSSSQKRGQWGERMVEDILEFIGFLENKNYVKQTQVESGEKPDYTFFLPKEKKLNMDVKFPLASYERFIQAELEEERELQKKEFLKDVKKHVNAIAGRSYVNPAEGTLDYVLMFIPNESIYGFINQEDSKLIDFALDKKVLLCSPLTLYAMLSLIHQATRNFAMEEKATEVMNLLNAFRQQWEKYVEVMDKMGRSLDTAKKDYDTMVGTRKNQLEKPLRKIDDITSGSELKEVQQPTQVVE